MRPCGSRSASLLVGGELAEAEVLAAAELEVDPDAALHHHVAGLFDDRLGARDEVIHRAVVVLVVLPDRRVLVDLDQAQRHLGDDAVAAEAGEQAVEVLGVLGRAAALDLAVPVDELDRQHVVDEHAEAVRGGADPADRREAADRDVAVVADDRQAEAERGEMVVDQRADRAALDRGGEAFLIDVDDLVHALHEQDGAALGEHEVVARVALAADLELLPERLALLDRLRHVLRGPRHVDLERELGPDLGVADPLPVVAEAVQAVVRERLVALDLAAPGLGRDLDLALL